MATVRFRQSGSSRGGRIFLILFGLLFAGVGGALTYFMLGLPVSRVLAARSWVAAPCVIESSRVAAHRSDDSTTYSIEVSYRYVHDGRSYRGDRYDFFPGASSGHAAKQRVVETLVPGSEATCYVNPDRPDESVFHRGWTGTMWFGLFPLIFLLVGVGVMIGGLRSGRGGAEKEKEGGEPDAATRPDWLPAIGHESAGDGRVRLRAAQTTRAKFIILLVVAAIWNGIIAIFASVLIGQWRQGHAEWAETLFLSLFAAVGLGLIAAAGYQLLAMFNPRIELTIDRAVTEPGRTLDLQWRIEGAVGRLRSIRIELVGEESATYRRGTDTVTDRHRFFDQPAYETPDAEAMIEATGRCAVEIPADAMHTFQSSNNSVQWRLRVRGAVPRWPDVTGEYALLIVPAGLIGAAGGRDG